VGGLVGLLKEPTWGVKFGIYTKKEAPVNSASKRLTIKECVKLVQLQTNQLTQHFLRSSGCEEAEYVI